MFTPSEKKKIKIFLIICIVLGLILGIRAGYRAGKKDKTEPLKIESRDGNGR